VLSKYFPGRLPVVNFLRKLKLWFDQLSTWVVSDFLTFLNDSQSSDAYLPPRQPWISCKGSREGLRGYPCSLWLLFHTLTVEAYNSRNSTGPPSVFDPLEVPSAIAGYVKHFFSCEDCSSHFTEMAATMKEEIQKPVDGVLWFWASHNKVNTRLKGDKSEDPLYPKLQFPPQRLCQKCKATRGIWNEAEVTNFLSQWYSRAAINISNVALTSYWTSKSNSPRALRLLDSRLEAEESFSSVRSEKGSWRSSWGFNAMDMSLCLVLYLSSALILLLVYFVVIVKRRLKKKSFPKISFTFCLLSQLKSTILTKLSFQCVSQIFLFIISAGQV